MNKIMFAFVAALALMSFGCKKKDGVKDAIGKLEGFKGQMCACKANDKACADKVEKDMKAYEDSMKGKEPDPKSVSKADQEKLVSIMMEMDKCKTNAKGADPAMAPPATPPADPAGATAPAGGTPPAPAGGADPAAAGGSAAPAAPPAGGEMKKEEAKPETK